MADDDPRVDPETRRWYLEHLREIPASEARRRAPWINTNARVPSPEGGVKPHWFVCDWWDDTTGLCMAHDERPPLCRGYPWYGRSPEEIAELADFVMLPPACEFLRDVGQEPVHVEIRPSVPRGM